ncbi:MAG: hypothetical protein Q8L81_04805 [Bacteroidota bacterium]|nr:hypothetical protein [Bacteroidota bacterium]
MKLIKILINVFAILVGAIMTLYCFVKLFKCFNGLTEAKDSYEVGYHIGYLITDISIGCLFAWIFWRGVSFFNKKKEVTKDEIEKMINDIDK